MTALTGANASTWDEVFHAAEQKEEELRSLREDWAVLKIESDERLERAEAAEAAEADAEERYKQVLDDFQAYMKEREEADEDARMERNLRDDA